MTVTKVVVVFVSTISIIGLLSFVIPPLQAFIMSPMFFVYAMILGAGCGLIKKEAK